MSAEAAARHAAAFACLHYRKPKRIRTAFSPTQLVRLEEAFDSNQYVVGQERKDLAASLSLTETQVHDQFCWHLSLLLKSDLYTLCTYGKIRNAFMRVRWNVRESVKQIWNSKHKWVDDIFNLNKLYVNSQIMFILHLSKFIAD